MELAKRQLEAVSGCPRQAVNPVIPLPNVDLFNVMGIVAEEHPDWSSQRLHEAEFLYRRFLAMSKMFPEEELTPVKDVDVVWHAHILSTAHYAQFCAEYLGHFLHHFKCRSDMVHDRGKDKTP